MWLYAPWASAPATEASSSASLSLASISDGSTELPLTSSGKLMRLRSLRASWKRNASIRRLSGLTCAPSLLDAGEAQWIASLQASPASRTATPATAPAPRTSAGSGPTSPGSCAIAVHGSSGWRTSQASLLPEESTPSSVTWPKWGSLRNGVAYLRPAWAPRTSGNASSSSGQSWMTPTTAASNGNDYTRDRGNSASPRLTIVGQSRAWPTPAARDAKGANSEEHCTETGGAGSTWTS